MILENIQGADKIEPIDTTKLYKFVTPKLVLTASSNHVKNTKWSSSKLY